MPRYLISQSAAMGILMNDGDYSRDQARIILGHARKWGMFGGEYYDPNYVYKRANAHAAKGENDANACA